MINTEAVCFIIGVLIIPILKLLLSRLFRISTRTVHSKDRLYDLDHGVLNLESPPKYMWMNLGFWKHGPCDLPSACKALLEEVLQVAGVEKNSSVTQRRLVDVGFGCGDQTFFLADCLAGRSTSKDHSSGDSPRKAVEHHDGKNGGKPLFDSYIGITLSESQYNFAQQRLQRVTQDPKALADLSRIQLYLADAANPAQWNAELKKSIKHTDLDTSVEKARIDNSLETWLLGLDCLYHFQPSRQLIFNYAFTEMSASIMAFDLFMGENTSLFDRLLLRIIAPFGLAPYSNFLTQQQYKDQLMAAGYKEENIKIRDISDDVFSGIVSFLQEQDHRLNMIGLSIGKFKLAGGLFRWWARTGIIRGCIVVARKG